MSSDSSSTGAAPGLLLRTGQRLPVVGLGTWKSKKGEVGKAIRAAIQAGYRHIDCASNYLNEDEIGDTLHELLQDGTVRREDLFITGKLNNPYHHREHVRPHLEKTLKDLRLDSLDLYLVHWPFAFHYVPYDASRRGFDADYDPDGLSQLDLSELGGSKLDYSVSFRETWEAMEELVDAGLVKAIGVSNCTAALLHDLFTYARYKPVVNQVELHPYLQQKELIAFCHKHGIQVEGYSPLGTSDFKRADEPSVLADETLAEIARRHGVTPAQVCLRWAVQRGTVVLPKSVHEERIRQNIDLFGFELAEKEMHEIAGLDRNYHFLNPKDWFGLPLFN